MGNPRTLVAARHMLEWTGEERWRDAADEQRGGALVAARRDGGSGRSGSRGSHTFGLATAHGYVGNVHALRPSLDDGRRAKLDGEANSLLAATAHVEDGLANWPGTVRDALPGGDGQIRLQWCTGAPGVVIAAGAYLEPELLLAGARLTWRAGPADDGEGTRHLPRDVRERLRVARGVRANRQRGVALPRPQVRGARARSGGGRPRALLALDGRSRRRGVRGGLHRGPGPIPDSRLSRGPGGVDSRP